MAEAPTIFFEDLPVGTVIDLGTFSLSAAEIIEFADRYDPQPFHTDPEAAEHGPFGGLVASGWHTGAMLMRRYVDTVLAAADSRGSPGLEELRWRRPLRPGDVVRAQLTVLEATPSARTPGRGTLLLGWEGWNQDGELVVTMRGRGLFGRRTSGAAGDGHVGHATE